MDDLSVNRLTFAIEEISLALGRVEKVLVAEIAGLDHIADTLSKMIDAIPKRVRYDF